jgi:hypothetical protein
MLCISIPEQLPLYHSQADRDFGVEKPAGRQLKRGTSAPGPRKHVHESRWQAKLLTPTTVPETSPKWTISIHRVVG